MIDVTNLSKEYRILERKPGFLSSVSSLFYRDYKNVLAVDDISFHVNAGEIVGFIGPNGAGKSTTIKMLTGVIMPTGGSISINGLDPKQDRKKHAQQIGVVFGQKSQLWWDIPVLESYKLLKSVYKINNDNFNNNMDIFNNLLQIDEIKNQPVRQLSLGQRMKADFVASLLHDPKLLFLDEPTIGVDIVSKQKIREFILEVNRKKNVTVLLTTHDIKDIEELCQRVIIIDYGKILFDGSISDLKNNFEEEQIVAITFEDNHKDISIPKTRIIKREGNTIYFSFLKDENTTASLIKYITTHYTILDISIKDEGIESIIKSIYEKKPKGLVQSCL